MGKFHLTVHQSKKKGAAQKEVGSFYLAAPTFVKEGEVLFDDGEQGDDWRLEVLIVQDVPVLGHVPRRVEEVLQVPKQLLVLAGQLLPRSP